MIDTAKRLAKSLRTAAGFGRALPIWHGPLLISTGRAVESVLNLVQVRVYSELLPVAEVGRLSLILAVTSFFTLLFASPMGSYIARSTFEWIHEPNRLTRELLKYAAFLVLLAPTAALILWVVKPFLVATPPLSYWPLLLLVAVSLVFFNLQQTSVTLVNILGDRAWFVILANGSLLISITLSVAFVLLIARTAELWLIGFFAGYGLVLPMTFRLIIKRQAQIQSSEKELASSILSSRAFAFVMPLAVSSTSVWVQGYGYRTVIAANTSESVLGIFTLGLTLGFAPMAVVTKIVTDYLTPAFYKDIAHQPEERQLEAWRSFSSRYVSAALVAAPLIAVSGPFLARFLLASTYWNYAWLGVFGAGFQMLMMIYGSYVMLAQGMRANGLLVLPNLVASAMLIGAVALLSLWRPLVGSGLGLIIGGTMLNVATAWRFHRKYKLTLAWRTWFEAALGGTTGAGIVLFVRIMFPDLSILTAGIVLIMTGLYFIGCMGLVLTRSTLVASTNGATKY